MSKRNAQNKKAVYCIDIDGTICSNTKGGYKQAKPFYDRIRMINRLYRQGNEIVLFSARGSTTGIDWREVTEQQLKDWGVKYHKLILGKPYAHYYVDDRAFNLFEKDVFSLKDKIAIITGSEGDIGRAIAQSFVSAGAKVYGIDIKKKLDIADVSAMRKFVKNVFLREGKIDILVNCAGITCPGDFASYSEKNWDKTIAINLKAPFKLSQIVSSYMKKTGGSIINITSLWAERGFSGNPAYGASKGGLKQLTKCLADDLAQHNIRVNNVGFGYIKTDMTRKSWKSRRRRRLIASKTMFNQWGAPEDVVGAIVFFASDASRYITGQDLYVDGGWLAKGL